jgi:hypothetical protein
VWQVLKYASYCSSLTKTQVKNIYQTYLDKYCSGQQAEENLKDFFDNEDYEEIVINKGVTQRIILVAANFRKEVTSTVLWLLNYKLLIQCFKVTPYVLHDNVFLNFEQIIPMKDSEEYIISMADKTQDDIKTQEETTSRHRIRIEFWKKLLQEMNERSDLFRNISPSKNNYLLAASGISSVAYGFVMSKSYARVEIYISRPSKDENKFIFDELMKHKDDIEQNFGDKLVWERLDNKKASRIKYQNDHFNVFNEDKWPEMIRFMVDSMEKLIKTFDTPLMKVN